MTPVLKLLGAFQDMESQRELSEMKKVMIICWNHSVDEAWLRNVSVVQKAVDWLCKVLLPSCQAAQYGQLVDIQYKNAE